MVLIPPLPDDLSGSLTIEGPGPIFVVILVLLLLYRSGAQRLYRSGAKRLGTARRRRRRSRWMKR